MSIRQVPELSDFGIIIETDRHTLNQITGIIYPQLNKSDCGPLTSVLFDLIAGGNIGGFYSPIRG